MNEFISTKAASEKLGLSIRRVQALITSGRLPAEKIGNSYVVREQNLKLVEDRPTGRPPKQAENKNGAKKPFKTAFDIAPDLMSRLLDKQRDLPADLSKNKDYLKDLGKKSAEKRTLPKENNKLNND